MQNHVVSQLKREVKRLREKDEALERRVQEMSEKDEALEEEVKHLRKDVEEQLMTVATFLPSPCQHGKPFYENHFKYVIEDFIPICCSKILKMFYITCRKFNRHL